MTPEMVKEKLGFIKLHKNEIISKLAGDVELAYNKP